MNLWTRLGVSVALGAGYFLVMTQVLQRTAYFEAHRWQFVIGLIGGGVFLLMTAQIFQGKTSDQDTASHTARYRAGGVWSQPAAPGSALLSLRYCGLMLMVFGVMTAVIASTTRATLIAAARHFTMGRTSRASAQAPPTRTASPARTASHLPSRSTRRSDKGLRLQGIIYRESNPSAIINGQPIFVGEKIFGAKVVAITMNSVTLNVGGDEQVLALRN